MKKVFILFFITLSFGFLMSFVAFYFSQDARVDNLFMHPKPTSSWTIFIHNLKILFVYRVPLLGLINYLFSFIIVFSTLGLSFTYQGILATLLQLPHLPFEILALSITASLSISRWKGLKYECHAFIIGTILLFVASVIEFYQQGVILCYIIFFLSLVYWRYKHKMK